MASDDVGLSPVPFYDNPEYKRHPNNTKTDQLPISEVITGLPRPYHNTIPQTQLFWYIHGFNAKALNMNGRVGVELGGSVNEYVEKLFPRMTEWESGLGSVNEHGKLCSESRNRWSVQHVKPFQCYKHHPTLNPSVLSPKTGMQIKIGPEK